METPPSAEFTMMPVLVEGSETPSAVIQVIWTFAVVEVIVPEAVRTVSVGAPGMGSPKSEVRT